MLLPYRNDNPLAWRSRARGWNIRYLMIGENSIGNVRCHGLSKEDNVKGLQVCLTALSGVHMVPTHDIERPLNTDQATELIGHLYRS